MQAEYSIKLQPSIAWFLTCKAGYIPVEASCEQAVPEQTQHSAETLQL